MFICIEMYNVNLDVDLDVDLNVDLDVDLDVDLKVCTFHQFYHLLADVVVVGHHDYLKNVCRRFNEFSSVVLNDKSEVSTQDDCNKSSEE